MQPQKRNQWHLTSHVSHLPSPTSSSFPRTTQHNTTQLSYRQRPVSQKLQIDSFHKHFSHFPHKQTPWDEIATRAFSLMAMLLRKVWGSVSNRSESSSSSDRNRIFLSSSLSSLGAFDQLPADILMQILRKLEAKDAVKMSVVCKSWKSLISDNLLWIFFLQNHPYESWDAIFFAETSLRSGYPLQ